AHDRERRPVLTAFATIAPLGWSVFVEQPLGEAFAPLYASAIRTVILLLLGVALAVVASLFLARRMVTPVQTLQAGAARIGADERCSTARRSTWPISRRYRTPSTQRARRWRSGSATGRPWRRLSCARGPPSAPSSSADASPALSPRSRSRC